MKTPYLRFPALAMAVLCSTLALPSAWSREWPSKPIRIIVPAPPGTITDGVARLVGGQLCVNLGQPLIIDNKPGGSAVIAEHVMSGQVQLTFDVLGNVAPLVRAGKNNGLGIGTFAKLQRQGRHRGAKPPDPARVQDADHAPVAANSGAATPVFGKCWMRCAATRLSGR